VTRRRGSIEQLPDKTWRYRFSYTDATGKRHQPKRAGFPTRKAAEQAMTAHMVAADKTSGVVTTDSTVADFLEAWYQRNTADNTWKATYRQTVRTHIRSYIVPRIGHLTISRLTPATFDAMKADLLTNGKTGTCGVGGLHAKTVRNILSTLHKAFREGVERRELDRHPMDGVKLPKADRSELVTWDDQQVNRFLTYTRDSGDYYYALWRLMFATGMRRGELLGLRWSDVDMITCRIQIRQTVVEINGRGVLSTPKTKAGRRTFTIDAGTRDALAMLANRQDEAAKAVGRWNSDRVATTLVGRPIHPRVFTRRFHAMCDAAGLPRTRVHDARHAAATMALTHGVPIHVVSARLGHEDVSTTLNIYADVLPSHDQHAANIVGDVLRLSSDVAAWTPGRVIRVADELRHDTFETHNDTYIETNGANNGEQERTTERRSTRSDGTERTTTNDVTSGDDGTRTHATDRIRPARRTVVVRRTPTGHDE
jgi:integrase